MGHEQSVSNSLCGLNKAFMVGRDVIRLGSYVEIHRYSSCVQCALLSADMGGGRP